MGRIRTIKPEFFTHSALFDLEVETKLPLRVAYAGLWTCCDREGRFKWRPRELKLAVLPFDDLDFSRVLDALTTRGFVVKYASEGEFYGVVPSFSKHQVINNRESESSLPNPSECNTIDACPTRAPRVDDAKATPLVGKGKEGKEYARVDDALPDWLPIESWNAFVEMRKKIKKPLTEHAKKLAINKLDRFRAKGYAVADILGNSVLNDWQDLYEPKEKPAKKWVAGDPTNPDDWTAARLPVEVV